MFKKVFALAMLATALFATPVVTNNIIPLPDCLPCDDNAR